MALPSKSLDKVSIQLKELQGACDNTPSIVPGSVVIAAGNGEPMKVESIDYTTGAVTVTSQSPMDDVEFGMGLGQDHSAPEAPCLVEICSADLQYTLDSGGRWLHPDIEVFLWDKNLTYHGYCPHCKHKWEVGMYSILEFSQEYAENAYPSQEVPPTDEVFAEYILQSDLKPCA